MCGEADMYGYYNNSEYEKYLSHPKWQKYREKILAKHKYKCDVYGCKQNDLEVHHKKYEKDRKPWEYPEDNFMVLCSVHHQQAHSPRGLNLCKRCNTEILNKYIYCYPCRIIIEEELKNNNNNSLSVNHEDTINQKHSSEETSKKNNIKLILTNITIVLVAFIIFIFYLFNNNSNQSRTNNLIVVKEYSYDNKKIQDTFLYYVSQKFSKKYFYVSIPDKESDLDIIVNYKFGKVTGKFFIKTVWLKRYSPGPNIRLFSESTFNRLKNFSKRQENEIYVIFGLGGDRNRPSRLFIIPFDILNSGEINRDLLFDKYETKKIHDNFFYDYKTKNFVY